MGNFRILDHTADVGLFVRGKDRKDLFETAARGMISILLDAGSISGQEQRIIEVEGFDDEELLLNWLREILYSVESEGLVYSRIIVEEASPRLKKSGLYRLKGRLEGEKLNPARHGICTEIKAITRHGMAIQKRDHGWELTLFFDV